MCFVWGGCRPLLGTPGSLFITMVCSLLVSWKKEKEEFVLPLSKLCSGYGVSLSELHMYTFNCLLLQLIPVLATLLFTVTILLLLLIL